ARGSSALGAAAAVAQTGESRSGFVGVGASGAGQQLPGSGPKLGGSVRPPGGEPRKRPASGAGGRRRAGKGAGQTGGVASRDAQGAGAESRGGWGEWARTEASRSAAGWNDACAG